MTRVLRSIAAVVPFLAVSVHATSLSSTLVAPMTPSATLSVPPEVSTTTSAPAEVGKVPLAEDHLQHVRVQPDLTSTVTDPPERPAMAESPEIVVTASRTPQRIDRTPDAISVVTADDLRMNNAHDLSGALERAPGVEVTPYGPAGSASSIAIRGSRPGQTLVLQDGRPLNSPVTGDADPRPVMTGSIDRVEVLRGPSGLLYGSAAVGGVVNVLTPRPPAEFSGKIEGQGGTFGTVEREISVGGPVGPTRWLLEEHRMTSSGARPNSAVRSEGFFLKGEAVEQPRITLSAGKWDDVQGDPGVQPAFDPLLRTASQLTFGNDDVSSLTDEEQNHHQFVDGRIEMNPLEGHEAIIHGYGDVDESAFRSSFAGFGDPIEERVGSTVQAQGIDAQYTVDPWTGSDSRITVGGGWRKERLNSNTDDRDTVTDVPTHTPGVRGRVETGSAFTELTFTPFESARFAHDLTLTGGARLDRNSRFGNIDNTHGGVAYDVGPVCFKVAGGTAFRAPTLSDLFWPLDAYGEHGNPDLKPERGQTYEAGIERHAHGVFVRATTFVRNIRDQIDWGLDSKGGYYPTNVGRVTTRGDEMEMSSQWRWLTAGGTVTVLRSIQQQAEPVLYDVNSPYGLLQSQVRERVTAHVPAYMAGATLAANLPSGTGVSIAGHGSGERMMYIPDTSTSYPGVVMLTKRLKPYATATLRVSQEFTSTMSVYAGIENLTDVRYASHFGRTSFDQDNRDYPMPGRTFFAGATARW